MRNGERQRPCPGGGEYPNHTYETRQRTSGGGEHTIRVANCPANHHAHFGLQITPAGKVAPHAQ